MRKITALVTGKEGEGGERRGERERGRGGGRGRGWRSEFSISYNMVVYSVLHAE
jgi:hypothetical protein